MKIKTNSNHYEANMTPLKKIKRLCIRAGTTAMSLALFSGCSLITEIENPDTKSEGEQTTYVSSATETTTIQDEYSEQEELYEYGDMETTDTTIFNLSAVLQNIQLVRDLKGNEIKLGKDVTLKDFQNIKELVLVGNTGCEQWLDYCTNLETLSVTGTYSEVSVLQYVSGEKS